ncbi:NAD-dependent dehydratase [Pseudonocardia halophobica]|uniref:NAD-dependent dehydratase n=1 Tax=Pseudonocardia halophobica TaxID=29401 RepID=A0A9W6UGA2_9PSEU|nr:NAD(P)-dependent oxidoreductase [Pseudonocardia halophobica]GLL16101.1 NAD-dependent dehydratase [Pseudonocardia halophobica]
MQRVLITGAGGRIGRMLRARMPRPDRELRLLDRVPVDEPGAITADVADLDAMIAACEGVDAVVHLGGISGEADWASIRDANIEGTYAVFEAARRTGVRRVVYASSNHAVGFVHQPDDPDLDMPDDVGPRPDTYYGVSKVLGEALGSLYHDRHGLDVVCLRIGTCADEPHDLRGLSTWLSPDDCARLVEAALATPSPGFRVVWGVSANTRRVWSPEGGAAIGYVPQDDAEVFAGRIGPGDPAKDEAGRRYVGGAFTL